MIRRYFCALAVLLFLPTLEAQTARTFVLKNSLDGESEIHCSLPEHPSGRAIVCCPGGGYTHLAFAKEGTDWAPFFNQQGIALFTLKYRMPNGDKQIPLTDAYNAIQTVRDSAQAWGINPYDVGIMGSSAGGHLAATVSTHAPFAVRPNFTILFYPVITLGQGTHRGSAEAFLGTDKLNADSITAWSAQHNVTHYATPPALLLLSNDDRVVPPVENGVAYYSAMRHEGLDCTMHIFPTGNHGWGYADWFPHRNQMLEAITSWLRRLPSPQANAIRISCIGNSITHGHGIDMKSANGYPALLQQILGPSYNVHNFGYSARTLMHCGDLPYTNETNWRFALDFNPDIAIIKLGTNDTKPHNWQNHGADFERDLQEMVDSLKARPSHPRIMLCTPLKTLKPSWGINDSIIMHGVIPAIRHIAEINHLEVIDLHTLISDEKCIQPDGIHPNYKGCEVMAQIIAEAIKKPAPVAPKKKSRRNK